MYYVKKTPEKTSSIENELHTNNGEIKSFQSLKEFANSFSCFRPLSVFPT